MRYQIGTHCTAARIRTLAVGSGIPIITTMRGASAAVEGIEKLARRGLSVRALQDYYEVGGSAFAANSDRASTPR